MTRYVMIAIIIEKKTRPIDYERKIYSFYWDVRFLLLGQHVSLNK